MSESLGRAAGTQGKPGILMPPPKLSKIAKRISASLKRRFEHAAAHHSAMATGRSRLAPATRAAYDLSFDRDDCRAPTTGFVDDRCSACPIGGHNRCGHLLHAVRPLRQCRVSQHGFADRSKRSRRSGKGCVASARRIPVGDGVGSLPARHLRIRGGGFQDSLDRRNRRRISHRKPTHGPRQLEAAPRLCRRARCGVLRSVRTRQFQVVPT